MSDTHNHICGCGGLDKAHETGAKGCFRYMTEAPIQQENDFWLVGDRDGQAITGYTLREQRGYHQHPCGCWSRHEGSENSIKA